MTTFVAGDSTDFGSTEELREIYNKMDKPNYVLLNNNKPATHCFEVYKVCNTTNQIIYKEENVISVPLNISVIDDCLQRSVDMSIKTIAIFKIRLK